MKIKRIFKYCEYCDKTWEDVSPPTNEEYQGGLIFINEFSTVLLNVKEGSHSANLEGIYCNFDCLIKHIKKLRKVK